MAAAHSNLGVALAAKGRLGESIAYIKKGVELDPKNAKAQDNLGSALGEKGRLDAAIASYKKAIELDPKLARAHNNLGIAMAAKGQLDEAIVWYKKAIELDPKLADAHSNMGNTHTRQRRWKQAAGDLAKAYPVWPDTWTGMRLGIPACLDRGGRPLARPLQGASRPLCRDHRSIRRRPDPESLLPARTETGRRSVPARPVGRGTRTGR